MAPRMIDPLCNGALRCDGASMLNRSGSGHQKVHDARPSSVGCSHFVLGTELGTILPLSDALYRINGIHQGMRHIMWFEAARPRYQERVSWELHNRSIPPPRPAPPRPAPPHPTPLKPHSTPRPNFPGGEWGSPDHNPPAPASAPAYASHPAPGVHRFDGFTWPITRIYYARLKRAK